MTLINMNLLKTQLVCLTKYRLYSSIRCKYLHLLNYNTLYIHTFQRTHILQSNLHDPIFEKSSIININKRYYNKIILNSKNYNNNYEPEVFSFINSINNTTNNKPLINEYCNAVMICLLNNKTSDNLFIKTCNIIENNSSTIDTENLVKMYNICHNKSETKNLGNSLNNQLLWNIPRMSLSNILIVRKSLETEHKELIELTEDRYQHLHNNISTPKDFLTLLYSDQTLVHRAIDYVDDMSTKQLYRLGTILANRGYRSKLLLRRFSVALKSKLKLGEDDLTLNQHCNMLTIYSQLNIYDKNVFDLLADKIISQLKKVISIMLDNK